ncbi:hypothetical protein PG994_001077 [Apiospora phragmitis]|uniref:Uncharacterized protein n=1 Tax=Apiospora phragmitis TaxID=2905665 RepID=A0ABR1WSI7_9PEZI
MSKARSCLQTYMRQLLSHKVGNNIDIIERAKAKIRTDQAGQMVLRWIERDRVRVLLEGNFDKSQTTREVLDLVVQIIVGGDSWSRVKKWLLKQMRKPCNDSGKAITRRVLWRRHVFTTITNAIHQWDHDGSSGHARKFFVECVLLVPDHVDLIPALIQALEEASARPSSSREDFKTLLVQSKQVALELEAELELLKAELCLYHPVKASPWEFKELIANISSDRDHPLRIDPPRLDPLERLFLMHRRAARCAELLEKEGTYVVAEQVLKDVKSVYNMDFLNYHRLAYGSEKGKKKTDPGKVKRLLKTFGIK